MAYVSRGGPLVFSVGPVVRLIACCPYATTVTNTTDELSLINSCASSQFLLHPSFFMEGCMLKYSSSGYISTGISQQSTFSIGLGSVELFASTGTLPNNLSNAYIELVLNIMCTSIGPSGVIYAHGRTMLHNVLGTSTVNMRGLISPTPFAIDTTKPNQFYHTYQWANASASNSVTIAYHEIEMLCLK